MAIRWGVMPAVVLALLPLLFPQAAEAEQPSRSDVCLRVPMDAEEPSFLQLVDSKAVTRKGTVASTERGQDINGIRQREQQVEVRRHEGIPTAFETRFGIPVQLVTEVASGVSHSWRSLTKSKSDIPESLAARMRGAFL